MLHTTLSSIYGKTGNNFHTLRRKTASENQSAIDIQSYIASIYIYLVFLIPIHIYLAAPVGVGVLNGRAQKKKNAVRAKTAGSAMQCDASRRLQYAGALLFLWERAAMRRDANASYYNYTVRQARRPKERKSCASSPIINLQPRVRQRRVAPPQKCGRDSSQKKKTKKKSTNL